MDRYTSGREPFEAIELDQDFCLNSYGDSVCGADLTIGLNKCFNTIITCQSLSAFNKGIVTLRFCSNRQRLPNDGNYYFPFLVSTSIKPCQINPGGADRNSSALGTRATINATFSDHPHTDRIVDQYASERITGVAQADGIGYDPFTRSTFWVKWRARNLYFLNRPVRHISGYIDEDGNVVDTVTRHFILTDFTGPDANGQVTIQGKDILTKINGEKAQAPRASSGKLLAHIDPVDSSLTLDPVGVGDGEYPASGWIRIGDEVMAFTRSGDTVTLTARGDFNTEAADHNAGDTVQICLRFASQRPDDITHTLLGEYAGIDDSLLALAEWEEEVDTFLPRLYSTIITEPTGVFELMSEVCEQMYFYIWFDERQAKVRLRAVRPAAGEEVLSFGQDNIIADTIRISDQPDQLITRVVINYAIRNPALGLDEPSNYRVTDIFYDALEEAPGRSDGVKIKTIFSRWLQGDDGAAATDLGEKLLARYKVPPKNISFSLDAKDRDLWVSDFASISTRLLTDPIGNNKPANIQIMSASESKAGSVFSYTGQQFTFELPPDPNDKSIDIASDEFDVNIRTKFSEKYGVDPDDSDIVRVTIRSGVQIGSSSTVSPAIDIGSPWPSGTTIILDVFGVSAGKGGNAGDGGYHTGPGPTIHNATNGGSGGTSIKTARPIQINNQGVIGGGGGGGGGGAGRSAVIIGSSYRMGGGGGAGGRAYSSGGVGGVPNGASNNRSGSAGSGGTRDGNGIGGLGGSMAGVVGGRGGDGGGLGQNGQNGTTGSGTGGVTSVGTGGASGYAIDGVSYVTWINMGDVRGPTTG